MLFCIRLFSYLKSVKLKFRLFLFDIGVIEVDEDINKGLGDSWGGLLVKFIKFEILDFEFVVLLLLLLDGLGYVFIVL